VLAIERRTRRLPSVSNRVRNPWLKKNPFLSMWLSGANVVAGAARGRLSAEARRQSAMMTTNLAKDIARFWFGAQLAPPKRKKRTGRRPV